MMGSGRFLLEGPYAIALVALGAGLLTVSHVLNYQLCRSCAQCEQEEFMEHSQVVLRATAVSLGYGAHTVLRHLHFEVHPGEFWFFLGQNGGGKTTLLKAILGLLTPQAGQLWLAPAFAGRERMGFVPQRCDLNPTLPTTVREFVLLGLVGIKVSRAEQNERLAWALEKMGLAGLAGRNYWSLSGGQRQRALVARALVRRPTLLILDEPTNNLDLPTEDALLRLLVALNKEEGLTLLFVTHNVGIAARYATHVGLLYSGNLLSGPRQQVFTAANLARIYGINVETALDLLVLNGSADLQARGTT
jgi:ABC-type Mn2+/Zn2+ transport system ATPase subunit